MQGRIDALVVIGVEAKNRRRRQPAIEHRHLITRVVGQALPSQCGSPTPPHQSDMTRIHEELPLQKRDGLPQIFQQCQRGLLNQCQTRRRRTGKGRNSTLAGQQIRTKVPRRTMGAFNAEKACSATRAAISAATPPFKWVSSTMTSRPVLVTDCRMADSSNGTKVRGSRTSASMPICANRCAAAVQERYFDELDAPIERIGGLYVPIPVNLRMEQRVIVDGTQIARVIREMVPA